MRKFGVYFTMVLIITILLPTVIIKTFTFVPKGNSVVGESLEDNRPIVEKQEEEKEEEIPPVEIIGQHDFIKIYNAKSGNVEEIGLEEYVKGVVAAEMPGEFHIEALKAQGVAARTYAISRTIRYSQGHPAHPDAPICTGIHCQAYLSYDQLKDIHGDSWIENYWGKIEEAVDSTKGLGIFYAGEIIESMYHSTSGGRTEDIKDVFASEVPYLKSVLSPNEEGAPKFKNLLTLTTDEFVAKIKNKYPEVKIDKDNIAEKIKLIEKTSTGRVKKIAIDGNLLDGSELRDLFGLNSTNFKISLDNKLNIIEIETYGYGHGIGMSQWGANGMGKEGSNYQEILKHYYTGVDIKPIE